MAYEGEKLRIKIEDGGPNADSVAIEIGDYGAASPKKKCLGHSLAPVPAAGEFLVGLP